MTGARAGMIATARATSERIGTASRHCAHVRGCFASAARHRKTSGVFTSVAPCHASNSRRSAESDTTAESIATRDPFTARASASLICHG